MITVHILTNISSRKSNRKIKFGNLMEYNMKNIFLENSYTKIPESFMKKQN